jgi:DNA-binding LytR/AlgR family response regulator
LSLRVLIVEDEALVAAELEWLVVDAGHEPVGSAVAGDEAVTLTRSHRPDLALVDVNLVDGATGVPAARELVALGAQVIFMTANPNQIPADFVGALGILPKPYTPGAVSQALAYAAACITPNAQPARRPAFLSTCAELGASG